MTSFKCTIINELGDTLRIRLNDNHPAFMGILNTLCGAAPVEWIGHVSHNKIFVCSAEIKQTFTSLSDRNSLIEESQPSLTPIKEFFAAQPDGTLIAFLREGITLPRVDDALISATLRQLLAASYKAEKESCTQGAPTDRFRIFCQTSEGQSWLWDMGRLPAQIVSELLSALRIIQDYKMSALAAGNNFWRLGELRQHVSSGSIADARVAKIVRSKIDQLSSLPDDAIAAFGILGNADITQLTNLKIACYRIRQGQSPHDFYESLMASERTCHLLGYTRRRFTDLGFEFTIPGKKGVCRFCGKSHVEGATFKKIPHAISYFLGNRFLLGGAECDNCNSFFGEHIEPHLHQYYHPTMLLCGILGRGKQPHIQGENFYQTTDRIKLIADDDDADLLERMMAGEEVPQQLNDSRPVIKADIYRCLCKYVISLINDDELPDFAETIRWIRRNRRGARLPATYRYEKLEPTAFPLLEIFRPIDPCHDRPGCIVAFYFLSNLWVYAVPYASGTPNGNLRPQLEEFIMHYIKCDFTQEDFSSESPTYTTTHITSAIGPDTTIKRFVDMTPDEQREFME